MTKGKKPIVEKCTNVTYHHAKTLGRGKSPGIFTCQGTVCFVCLYFKDQPHLLLWLVCHLLFMFGVLAPVSFAYQLLSPQKPKVADSTIRQLAQTNKVGTPKRIYKYYFMKCVMTTSHGLGALFRCLQLSLALWLPPVCI